MSVRSASCGIFEAHGQLSRRSELTPDMVISQKQPKSPIAKPLDVRVNGIGVGCASDARVLDAVRDAGFDVPTLCYDERIGPQGIGSVGMVLNFAVMLVVSRFTPPPPADVQANIAAIRSPRVERLA